MQEVITTPELLTLIYQTQEKAIQDVLSKYSLIPAYVTYEEACDMYTKKRIDSLIRRNILVPLPKKNRKSKTLFERTSFNKTMLSYTHI